MKWSANKFRNAMQRLEVSYEDVAERLVEKDWITSTEAVVLVLKGFAQHQIVPRLGECLDIAEALGVDAMDLLIPDNQIEHEDFPHTIPA